MGNSESTEKRSQVQERDQMVIAALRDSGVLNFEQLGKAVSQVAPTVFDPGTAAAGDYVVKGVESVIHIYKLDPAFLGLEEVESIRAMAAEVSAEGGQ